MKNTIVKFAVLLCLLIDNIQVKGHQRCFVQRAQKVVKTKGCGIQKIVTTGCKGHCTSESTPRLSPVTFAVTCSCCRPIKQRVKRVVVCNSPREEIRVPVAKKCACRPCTMV